jgi:hypothetical protein
MEIRCGFRYIQDVDIRRQDIIEFQAENFGSEHGAQIEIGDLAERMNAGVGSPRTVELKLRGLPDFLMARSSPCTERAFFCTCHPR